MDRSFLRALRELDEYELRRLIIYAQGLLVDTEGPHFDVSAEAAPEQAPRSETQPTYRRQSVRCGKENCSSCPHGPYWYAYWREGGRVRSRYVGKTLPDDVRVDTAE